jgi:hypothetical protein
VLVETTAAREVWCLNDRIRLAKRNRNRETMPRIRVLVVDDSVVIRKGAVRSAGNRTRDRGRGRSGGWTYCVGKDIEPEAGLGHHGRGDAGEKRAGDTGRNPQVVSEASGDHVQHTDGVRSEKFLRYRSVLFAVWEWLDAAFCQFCCCGNSGGSATCRAPAI